MALIGARPGDVLEAEVLTLLRRAPYGVISNRHGKGALPGEYPQTPLGEPASVVATVSDDGRRRLPVGDGRQLAFPLRPFLGIMGVAPATESPVHSVPRPARTAETSTSATSAPAPASSSPSRSPRPSSTPATRTSPRATAKSPSPPSKPPCAPPFAETPSEHIVLGLDHDLDEALRNAVRDALTLLTNRYAIPAPVGLA